MAAYEDRIKVDIYPLKPVDQFEWLAVELYKAISKRDIARLCWQTYDPPTSLRKFLDFLDHPILPFIALHDGEIAGFFWLQDIASGIQCEYCGWIPFRYRGVGSEAILQQGLEFSAEKMGFPTVFCRTPFASARAICRRAGMIEVAELDFYSGTKANKLYVLRYDHG